MQKLIFGQKMQESMHILQMPLIELKNLIENEMETNPLLEESQLPPSSPDRLRHKIDKNDVRRELRLTKPLTLQDHLLRQLGLLAATEEESDIGEEIIGNIDDDGYLKAGLDEIAQPLGVNILKIEAMVVVIQSFEPAGVCARDLKECLLIQLEANGKEGSIAWKIVEAHLDECGKKQYAKIAKALGVSMDKVQAAVAEIARLEPKPGRKYSDKAETQYIVPDIFVKKVDDEYQILSNQFDIPSVRVSSLYRDILNDKNSDEKTQDYIREKLTAANFMIKCIRQRQETMRKITEFLVKEQGECLEKGRSFMKPLNFETIAKAIGRHQSTISRAIANKYIDTPSGIYELREFFNGKIAHTSSEDDHSSTSVKLELKNIIDNEDKRKPLSDQKLQKILTDKEIKISRRTIAKYREELKILPSYLRKN
ncbi:MAG: RNA polymerase factor sigma-54 [Candidatus Omnitrophica bacterium]|nr:RNA polymerase factor sigma-54 [Candidatus Omnitrophota bacterium]MBU1933241.1 RNA polymerase factor sigma-54 [Candidatus Omnitrophota bacterium]